MRQPHVAVDDMYGGSWRLFERVRKRSMGLKVSYSDPDVNGSLEKALQPGHEMSLGRERLQPAAQVTDLAHIAKIGKVSGVAHRRGHTFASHSCSGRSISASTSWCIRDQVHQRTLDMVGGNRGGQGTRTRRENWSSCRTPSAPSSTRSPSFLALCAGSDAAAAHEATLRHAMHLAAWLMSHPQVERVIYPGLPATLTPVYGGEQIERFRRHDRCLSSRCAQGR